MTANGEAEDAKAEIPTYPGQCRQAVGTDRRCFLRGVLGFGGGAGTEFVCAWHWTCRIHRLSRSRREFDAWVENERREGYMPPTFGDEEIWLAVTGQARLKPRPRPQMPNQFPAPRQLQRQVIAWVGDCMREQKDPKRKTAEGVLQAIDEECGRFRLVAEEEDFG